MNKNHKVWLFACRYKKYKVSLIKDDKMDYEKDLDLCEYNPMSIQLEQEMKALAKIVEAPSMSFFQRLMKKIICLNALN